MRNTPVTWPRAELNGGVPVTGRRFALVMNGEEIALTRGELLLGRSRSCQVAVDDMLVSRHHARLLVSKTALFVEDLGSTNGVMVNEMPISGPTPLSDGDRVIVGTQELVVRALEDVEETLDRPVQRQRQETPKAQPAVQIQAVARVQPTRPELPAARSAPETAVTQPSGHPGMDGADTRTEKADGLLTMARMADRMMALGRHEAAARLLGDHLKSVLARAKEGRAVPRDVLDTVGTYGVKLTLATRDPLWSNIAIELHVIARRPLTSKALATLHEALNKVPGIDRPLLLRLKAALRDDSGRFSAEEQAAAERCLGMPVR